MRYPRINGLGVHGTIRTYASKQYNISGSVAPALKSRWEAETENNLRNLDALNGKVEFSARNHWCTKQSCYGRKMMQYLKHAKKALKLRMLNGCKKNRFCCSQKKYRISFQRMAGITPLLESAYTIQQRRKGS